ncbi:MAG: serine/threonine-protein kinase [Polyangiales bacterium]
MDPSESDSGRHERRIRETAQRLGECAPDATIRPDPTAGGATLDRTLPTLVIDRASGGSDVRQRESLTLRELLGEGGMGKVYAGVQRSLGRAVAVKVLEGSTLSDRARAALLHEARVTGRLEHPNIVPVHVLGVDESGHPVMVMKRIEGVSWRKLLQDASHPAWTKLLSRHRDRLEAHVEILLRVCDALEYAHAQGVLHRDLKPDNVMLGAFGEVYLLDWGVALQTHARPTERSVVGTPAYMAPEMVDGDPANASIATDVYLLGATLHEALTGATRHTGEMIFAVLFSAHRSLPIAYGPEVPPELGALCNDATSREAARRPASVDAFRARLLAWRQHRGSTELSDDAARALERAERLVSERDREAATRALREARLGFAQALSAWPENTAARAGLGRTFAALVQRAIDDESPEAARALYAAWPEPDPSFVAAIEALEAHASAGRSLSERSAAMERDMDTATSREGHTATLAVFTAIVVLATGTIVARGGTSGPPPPLRFLLAVNVTLLVSGAVVTAALRRRVLGNLIGRRITVLLLGGIATVVTADVAAELLGTDTHVATVMHLALLGVGLFTAATQGLPMMALPGVIATATAVAAAVAPSHLNLVAMTGTVALALAVLWVVGSGRLGVAAPVSRPVTAASQPPRPSAAPSERSTTPSA